MVEPIRRHDWRRVARGVLPEGRRELPERFQVSGVFVRDEGKRGDSKRSGGCRAATPWIRCCGASPYSSSSRSRGPSAAHAPGADRPRGPGSRRNAPAPISRG